MKFKEKKDLCKREKEDLLFLPLSPPCPLFLYIFLTGSYFTSFTASLHFWVRLDSSLGNHDISQLAQNFLIFIIIRLESRLKKKQKPRQARGLSHRWKGLREEFPAQDGRRICCRCCSWRVQPHSPLGEKICSEQTLAAHWSGTGVLSANIITVSWEGWGKKAKHIHFYAPTCTFNLLWSVALASAVLQEALMYRRHKSSSRATWFEIKLIWWKELPSSFAFKAK